MTENEWRKIKCKKGTKRKGRQRRKEEMRK